MVNQLWTVRVAVAGLALLAWWACATPQGTLAQSLEAARAGGALNQIACQQHNRTNGEAAAAEPLPAGQSAPTPYRDPRGRYSLMVAPGWNATTDANGSAQLTSGPSWATIGATSGNTPTEVNHQILGQIQAQYKNFQLLNEGDFQANGNPAHGANATGINPKGARVSVLVIAISAGQGHFLVVVSSAPNDQAKAVNADVMQMVNSIRFGG